MNAILHLRRPAILLRLAALGMAVLSISELRADDAKLEDRVELLVKTFDEIEPLLEEEATRPEAIKRLKAVGPEDVVAAFSKQLLETDESDRYHRRKISLLRTLDEQGFPAAGNLIEATDKGLCLGKTPTSLVIPLENMIREQPDLWQRLVPIASHESAEARIWAIRMGRLCLPTQPEAVSVWYEFVLDETRSLPDRGQAIYALATAPSLTIEQCNTLTDLLVNDLGRLHWAANAALVTRTESSLPVLQQRLPSAPPELQTKILHCLRQMGTKAAESRELVKNEFSSSEPTVRAAAGSAWWNITGQAEPVVALLLDELEQEPSADVFDLCIELGKEGAKLSDSIARHLRVSRDSETFDPLIAEALGSIGPAAKQHVDLLDQSLSRGSNKWFGQVAVARVSIARSAGGVADEFGCRLGKAIDLGIEDNEALRETLDLLRAGKLLGKHVAECQPQLSELYLIMQEKATRQLVLNVFKAIGKPSLGSLESLAKHPGLGDRARRSLERTISQINRD